MWRVLKYSKYAPLNPLGRLRKYQPEESRQIRNLLLRMSSASVSGGSEIIKVLLGSKNGADGNEVVWLRRVGMFWGFHNVEEFLVGDRFKDND